MKLDKVIKVTTNVVYWCSLVGPIYSLVVGTVKGFISAVQHIREEEKQKQQNFIFDNPDDVVIDLSTSQKQESFFIGGNKDE